MKQHRLSIIIEEANKVAAECYAAAVSLTEHSMKEARLSEQKFERRFGESWRKYSTLSYDEWQRTDNCKITRSKS